MGRHMIRIPHLWASHPWNVRRATMAPSELLASSLHHRLVHLKHRIQTHRWTTICRILRLGTTQMTHVSQVDRTMKRGNHPMVHSTLAAMMLRLAHHHHRGSRHLHHHRLRLAAHRHLHKELVSTRGVMRQCHLLIHKLWGHCAAHLQMPRSTSIHHKRRQFSAGRGHMANMVRMGNIRQPSRHKGNT